MHYLVTGGAGFIGANLVKKLLQGGHHVAVLDNFCAGRVPERMQSGATYIEGDIRNEADVKKAGAGADGIFHLAAVPRVPYSVEHPFESHDNNVTGTLKVLIAARDLKIKRVVFASSSAVYGDQKTYPLTEDLPTAPVSPYGLQKLQGEEYCRLFSRLYGVETVCLRYFNVYGLYFDPNGPYALVIGKFLLQRKNGQPLTICGDGEYYRDYTHVFDVAEANILAMTKDAVGRGEVLNIGRGDPHSVNELARLIGGPTVSISPRPGDMRFTQADTSKARELLGWEPKIFLSEGLEELKREYLFGRSQ